MPKNTYTTDQRIKALKYYLIGLNLNEVSKLTDIPVRTLEKWQTAEQWTEQRNLTNVKQKALQFYEAGKTYLEIGTILDLSTATVMRYIKAAKEANKA